jgi:hypothetical protein
VSHVLGNESNAMYLKKWLNALALPGSMSQIVFGDSKVDSALPTDNRRTNRPHVVRVADKRLVLKKRRVQSDDDSDIEQWIIDNEALESSESDSKEGVSRDCTLPRRAGTDSSQRSYKRKTELSMGLPENFSSPDFSTLTNTILLEGPPGSGKTSTIYACAEELGWDVFEVYPGIGKRSGVNISSLIGDVGTNHLVGSRRVRRHTHTKHSSRDVSTLLIVNDINKS